MSRGFFLLVDPAELANWAQAPGPYDPEDEPQEGVDPGSAKEELAKYLPYLPLIEADILELWLGGVNQEGIGMLLGITQAAVSYRIQRAGKRIRFLRSSGYLDICPVWMESDLAEVFKDPLDIEILMGMWLTTSQSATAERLGTTQGRVRHRFIGALGRLEKKAKEDPYFERYVRLFTAIREQPNALREVALPQWEAQKSNLPPPG